jgi:hypothetical protein
MKVKLLKDYEGGKKGEVIEVEDAQGSTLKIRGIASKALDEKAEKAVAEEKQKAVAKAERLKKPVKKTSKK